MQRKTSETASSALTPTTPPDVGERSQRRRIVEAMIASCAEKTYAATTISDIVARARISRTTFYKRFADKRACFGASLEHCIDELRSTAAAAHSPANPPAEAVRKATAAMLARMAERPEMGQLLTGDAVAVEPVVVDRYRRLVIAAVKALWDGEAPRGPVHTDPRLALGRAQLLIFNKIAAGRSPELPSLLPEIVYLAVAPFDGHSEALRQARLAEEAAARDAHPPDPHRDGDR